MTKPQQNAIDIIRKNPGIGARHFAELAWKPQMTTPKRQGQWMRAGRFLIEMKERGLLRTENYGRRYFVI